MNNYYSLEGAAMMIRKMTIDDYDSVCQLWLGTPGMGLNDVDDSRAGIDKYLRRNPDTCFVAEEDGRVIGAVLSGHDGRRALIYHLAVREDHQRRGIGEKLLDEALRALRDEGILKVALVVLSNNEKGNAFWEKNEFADRKDLVYRNRQIGEFNGFHTQ
jgi:ribosomal protein S18 acetylase RimI-like enzyme